MEGQPKNLNTLKQGGQPKNLNALIHGTYSYLALGRLPKGCAYIRRLIGKYRRKLEDALLERDGEIQIHAASLVQSACRHEGRAQLLTRWLRVDDGDMSITDRVSLLREIGSATDSRDRCLKALELSVRSDNLDPWAALDVRPALAIGNDEPPSSSQHDETEESDTETPASEISDSRVSGPASPDMGCAS